MGFAVYEFKGEEYYEIVPLFFMLSLMFDWRMGTDRGVCESVNRFGKIGVIGKGEENVPGYVDMERGGSG